MRERSDPLRMGRVILASGLEVVLQTPPASARSFSMSFVAPAGWGFEPPDKEALATIAAKMVVGTPGKRSREELARLLDRLGASLTSSVAPESAEVTVWGPEDAWEPLLAVFADAIFRPRFEREELGRVQRQLRERQLRQMIQPELRADREFLANLFPAGHPYRSTGIGTVETTARISTDDLRRFHRSHYPVRGSVLIATARGSRESLVRSLDRSFAASGFTTGPSIPALDDSPQRRHRENIEIPGQSQVAIRVGARSVSRGSPDYPQLFLGNEVLGGRPLLSRLFQRIREQHGLAYHASSELESMRWGGYWEASAGTDPKTRDRVVRLIVQEIDRLGREPIPIRELDRIRESVIGSIPLELETTASAHELAVDVAYHRLPGDFYRSWPDRLRAVRPRDIRLAAEERFSTEHAVVVTAGPAGS